MVARLRHRIVGDASPSYLWWPNAMERMRDYNPEMKVIGIFRDPIERLFSQWTMIVSRWPKVARSWQEFLTRYAPDALQEQVPQGVGPLGFRMHSGVVRGFYGGQLDRAIRLFGPDQVRALEFRAFLRDHDVGPGRLTDFLDIPPVPEPPGAAARDARQARSRCPRVPPASRSPAWSSATGPTSAGSRSCPGWTCASGRSQRMIDGDLDPEELAAPYLCRKLVITPAGSTSPAADRRGPRRTPGRSSSGTVIGRFCRGRSSAVT